MDNPEIKMPRKFPFDEYYEMLREYVNDPKAREALSIFDSEYAAGRGWAYQVGSEVATDALSDFMAVGWSILVEHGWPTHWEALELRKIKGLEDITAMAATFPRIARRLIRTEPGAPFPEMEFRIEDRNSVLECLTLWLQDSPRHQIYTLPEGE